MAQYQIEMKGAVSLSEYCDVRDDDTALEHAAKLVVERNRIHRGLGGKCQIHVIDEDGEEVAEYEATWETWH
jgi:hypothetical protein